MGWGFRKRVKILPGVYINLSKSGMSTSVGVKGLTYNFSRRGTTRTMGIPGTGLYHKEIISKPRRIRKTNYQYEPSEELLLREKLAAAKYYIDLAQRELDESYQLYQQGIISSEDFTDKINSIESNERLIGYKQFISELAEQREIEPDEPETTFPLLDIIMWACILVLAVFFIKLILR